MKRFILTGTPGSGKTSILRLLERSGFDVVEEAATDVIAAEQALGVAQPWMNPGFLDRIVSLQRQRQLQAVTASVNVQLHDRSPICTLALSRHLGLPTSPVLAAEIDRITHGQVFEREVFFVRNLRFCEPTAARKISFEEAVQFERLHEEVYRGLGYDLIDVPAGEISDRIGVIRGVIVRSARQTVPAGRADDHARPGRPSRPGVI
jgi:predicted ATPase